MDMDKEITKKILITSDSEYTDDILKKIAQCKRDHIEEPVIYIIGGTSGSIAGSDEIEEEIKNHLKTHSIKAKIINVGSLGYSSAEPMADIQLPGKTRISFGKVKPENISLILDSILNNVVIKEHVIGQYKTSLHNEWDDVADISELSFFRKQQRIILQNCGIIDPEDISNYIAVGGYKSFIKALYNYPEQKLIEILEKSQLRGRGGGGFPLFKKMKVCASVASDQKYVICNADESDPGAFMDRSILEGDPHKIIEGVAIAAYAINASIAYIYLRSEYTIALNRIEKAIQQAKDFGLLGHNIYDSGFNLEIFVKKGAGAFVCGEETALINSIEGKRGMPRPKPPYPAEKGLYGKPTLINNIETIANIPSIVKKGPNWFTSIGTEKSKGTKIFALSGDAINKGLIEVPMGTSLSDIVFEMGGGIRDDKPLKAIQLGGPTGTCIPKENIETRIDYEELENIDAFMGSGGMVVIDEDKCMVDTARFFMEFIKKESCGKCIPCREGSRRMLEILESITKRPDKDSKYDTLERFKGVTQLEDLAAVISQTSLCGLGKTAPNPVISTMKWFREEYEEHIFERNCLAGVCTGLKKYEIDVEHCVGCGACKAKCPVNAVIGSKKMVHFIIEEKCIGCGMCFEACKFSAIFVK